MRWLFAPPPKKPDPLAKIMADRAALLKRERELSRRIERLYRGAKKAIEPQLQELTAKIKEAEALGLTVGPSWLAGEARMTALLAQIELQLGAAAKTATKATEQAQRVGIGRGSKDAIGAMREAAKYAGVASAFDVLPTEALEHLAGTMANGTPLAAWFDAIGPTARESAAQTLFNGLAQGISPYQIARDLRGVLDISKTSAMITARQASIGAYRAANLAEYQANSDVLSGWRWVCSYSIRTCAMCIAMDGTEHAADEQMVSHLECRCSASPILADGAEQTRTTGSEWFAGQDAETQNTILGPLKGELYRSGDISLADLVKQGTDVTWGDWRAEKSVRDLVSEGSLSNRQVNEAASAAR